ncbi:hypothetical protein GIB67_015651 [Kingdonia uniflora]|uniref:Transcription factor VOZ1 n=1 Tax=Kingdonia uniflora TaxID=39325 RepID=A0A7J7NU71_9MAGN|nr:hypothetical protein GIB67_015651 [Kingdonia uniflora]
METTVTTIRMGFHRQLVDRSKMGIIGAKAESMKGQEVKLHIPAFDGKDTDAFIDWLNQLDKILEYKCYEDPKTLVLIETKLTDYALINGIIYRRCGQMHELFDLSILEQETVREWLFFDKPRRAFESGNRKQRSLPDYKGRGWHESRKQVMAEFGGLKRSYYMDPQPRPNYEWHLFEYEINNCDACALYRLEFKNVEGKKSPKGKVTNDPLSDLQKQMGRLTAVPVDNKRSVKGRTKASPKGRAGANTYSAPNQAASSNQNFSYEGDGSYGYLVDNLSDYYEA